MRFSSSSASFRSALSRFGRARADWFRPVAALGLVLSFAWGCGAPPQNGGGGSGSGSGVGDGQTSTGGGSFTTDLSGGDLSGVDLSATDGSGGGPPSECDASGHCVCIKLATWGSLGTYGAVPGMDGQDAITAWLNDNSTGEAEYFATKPAISAESLESYDVLVLQNLSGWSFTADEKAAVEAWVRAGGGIVSLAGYGDQPNEMTATNDLLAFSGLSYVGLQGAGDISTSPAETCAYCLGNSDAQGGWDPTHPIAANITAVGALWGRSISPGVGVTVATWNGKRAGATVEVDGGRVFLFHDEWVTYNSQWDGSALQQDCRTNGDQACMGTHPTLTYQIPQFWFNAIRWLSHAPECFVIRDDTIVK